MEKEENEEAQEEEEEDEVQIQVNATYESSRIDYCHHYVVTLKFKFCSVSHPPHTTSLQIKRKSTASHLE